jgi:hypothetical protein
MRNKPLDATNLPDAVKSAPGRPISREVDGETLAGVKTSQDLVAYHVSPTDLSTIGIEPRSPDYSEPSTNLGTLAVTAKHYAKDMLNGGSFMGQEDPTLHPSDQVTLHAIRLPSGSEVFEHEDGGSLRTFDPIKPEDILGPLTFSKVPSDEELEAWAGSQAKKIGADPPILPKYSPPPPPRNYPSRTIPATRS